MGSGEWRVGEGEPDGDEQPAAPLVDDLALLCPITSQPCPVKVGLREDYQAGDVRTAAAREAAAVQLGIALALHESAFAGGDPDCQPGQACPVPATPFEMTGPRTFTSIAAAAFHGL